MSVQPSGRPSIGKETPLVSKYERHSIEGTKTESEFGKTNKLQKGESSNDKLKESKRPSIVDNSRQIQSGVRLKSRLTDLEATRPGTSKSFFTGNKASKTSSVETTESKDTEQKSKRRVLVKQPTHGKFELKTREIVKPDEEKREAKSKANYSAEIRIENEDTPTKRRVLPSTPFSLFNRKDLADGRFNVESKNHQGLAKHPEKGSSYSSVDTNALHKASTVTEIYKGQPLLVTATISPQFIPLQSLKSKLVPSQNALTSKEYEKKYRERIRLRDRSVSLENSAYVDDKKINPTSVKAEIHDGKKSVAFCTVHSSGSFDQTDARSVRLNELKPVESQFVSQHKQYLSPDNCLPMLEKSKSLQRLGNQSSTETSGLGETVTSGFSSQESVVSYYTGAKTGNTDQVAAEQDQGIDLREDTRTIHHEGNSTLGIRIIDSDNIINHTNGPKKSDRGTSCAGSIGTNASSGVSVPDTNKNQSEKRHGASGTYSSKEGVNSRDMTNRLAMGQTDHLSVRGYRPPLDFRSNDVKKPDNLPMFSSNVGPDFDTLFTQSKNLKVPPQAVGIQIDQINNEWEKHNRSASIKSRSSQGSFRSRSGSTRRSRRFLGEKESTWMKWGRERRLSFRKRMENLEKPPEPEVPRASTPVKKARQEGLMFVHPDLGSKYISEDDIDYIKRHKQERLKTCKLIEKSKTKLHYEAHDLNRLTADELMTLSRFWEHRVFVRSRYVSILLSLVTTVIYVLSICSTQWVTYPSPGAMDHYAHEGLWFKCSPVLRNKHYTESCEDPTGRSWQNAVIGLMIFSAAFGFVAAVLAICGVCTSPLPKKIYYFHSAGEIFFVCALTTTVALIMYAVAISTDDGIHSHTYGSGYGLGWGGTAFFFAASFCMSLDELVRESAQNKCCRYLFWRSRSNDRDNSQNV